MSRGYTGWTYISSEDQVLDIIVRSCYNSLAQLLVTQRIAVVSKPVHNPAVSIDSTRFQRVGHPKLSTTYSTISTEDKTIAYIETKGNFNRQILDEYNEVAYVVYEGDGGLVNDVTIPIATFDGIYIVGDIIVW